MPRAEINDDAKNVSLLSADELTRMAQAGALNSHVRWRWGPAATTTTMAPIIINDDIFICIVLVLAAIGLICLCQAICRLTRNFFKCPIDAEQSLILRISFDLLGQS
jgi:hypothetical protein